MKKIYVKPAMVEVRVHLQNHLMEGSPIGLSDTPASVNSDGYYENSLSRSSYSAWGDDDD